MTKLSVNINKIATLRNARGGNNPDVLLAAINCQRFGAQGITVHPRPDERHIRKSDVYNIKEKVQVEFNIEGYPSEEFIRLVLDVKPDQVTLVPDPPEALTSNSGWNVQQHFDFLRKIIDQFKNEGIRTSIFIDTDIENILLAAKTGTDRVELYTEPYAVMFPENPDKAVNPFVKAAKAAIASGIGLNAGHDLSLENLNFFAKKVPGLKEVSIGHALVCDALYYGLENTIQMYLRQLDLSI